MASQLSETEQTTACNVAAEYADRVRTAVADLPASCNDAYDSAQRAKAYKAYLSVSYLGQDGAWQDVARLEESCVLAAAVDKCSGCRGLSACSREVVGENYQSQTRRGELSQHIIFLSSARVCNKIDFELCPAIAEAGKLSTSEFVECHLHT